MNPALHTPADASAASASRLPRSGSHDRDHGRGPEKEAVVARCKRATAEEPEARIAFHPGRSTPRRSAIDPIATAKKNMSVPDSYVFARKVDADKEENGQEAERRAEQIPVEPKHAPRAAQAESTLRAAPP